MEEYRTIKRLGGGGQGHTSVVERRKDKRQLCMKTIPCNSIQAGNMAMKEAKMLQKIHHQGVVKFVDVFLNESFGARLAVSIVMELCTGGDLSDYTTKLKRQKQQCPEALATNYISQIATALAHIHKKGIIHRDMKPMNIFIASGDAVKIGDFGIAMIGDSSRTQLGTPLYFSPEVATGKKYGEASDVWGLGCIAYELLSLDLQMQNGRPGNFLSQRVARAPLKPESMPSTYSEGLRSLVCRMLSHKPEDRPSAAAVASQLGGLGGAVVGCVTALKPSSSPNKAKPAAKPSPPATKKPVAQPTAKKANKSSDGIFAKLGKILALNNNSSKKKPKAAPKRPPTPPLRGPPRGPPRVAFAA